MNFKFVNSWKSWKTLQSDKFALKWRIGKVTILDISIDKSRKELNIKVLNFGIERI